MPQHTDLFVEVTNVTKGNGIWTHVETNLEGRCTNRNYLLYI